MEYVNLDDDNFCQKVSKRIPERSRPRVLSLEIV